MARRIAIVHHRRSFFPLDLRRHIGEDLEPIWVLADEPGADRALRRLLTRSGPVVEAHGLEVDRVAQLLAEHRPEGIVTFVDDTLCLTAAIAARLGLPFHTEEQAATIADKTRQRAAFAAAGLPGPRFWTLAPGLDPARLRERAGQIAYPAVLKPAHSSASRGMHRLQDACDLLTHHDPTEAAVVEEYLDDTVERDTRFASYLSVESIVHRGRVSHVAICGRFSLAEPFRETGNFIPAAVPCGLRDEILRLAENALHALSIDTAVCHTEIKLTPHGPQLIEVNGRLGGRPPLVLLDISEVNLFRVACTLALGDDESLTDLAPTRGVGFLWMSQPPVDAVRLRAVHGVEDVASADAVHSVVLHRTPGMEVDCLEGTDGKVVTVRGVVHDHDALAAAVDFVATTLRFDYERSDPAAAPGDVAIAVGDPASA